MNEQEMLAKKKVEQREKTDTILAYALIVILLGCILIVLYLKFIRKENEVTPQEQIPTNSGITLETISDGFNNSNLVSNYSNDGKTINSTVSESFIVINYENGEDTKNYEVSLLNNELVFDVTAGDTVIEDVYKEIAYVICTNLGSGTDVCRTAADSLTEESSTIRFEKGEETSKVYISIVNSIAVNNEESETSETVYTSETVVALEGNNYTLNIDGVIVKDIIVKVEEDNSIQITGTIESDSTVKVIAKIYDAENSQIAEKESEEVSGDFTIIFDSIEDINNVANYSINVEK